MSNKEYALNNKAKFIRYEKGVAYYAVMIPFSEKLYSFPVPVNSVHDEILSAEKNALFFAEHIRDAIQNGTLIKEAA